MCENASSQGSNTENTHSDHCVCLLSKVVKAIFFFFPDVRQVDRKSVAERRPGFLSAILIYGLVPRNFLPTFRSDGVSGELGVNVGGGKTRAETGVHL